MTKVSLTNHQQWTFRALQYSIQQEWRCRHTNSHQVDRAHSICYWIFHTISVPTPQQQNSNIHSIKKKKEKKKNEQYLGGFLEWRHQIVKPKQRITIGYKPGPKTSSPIANKRKHMHRYFGPRHRPKYAGTTTMDFLSATRRTRQRRRWQIPWQNWYRHA